MLDKTQILIIIGVVFCVITLVLIFIEKNERVYFEKREKIMKELENENRRRSNK